MSCSVCNGFPGCPCCSEDNTIDCPNCRGEGKVDIYFDEYGEGVSFEIWEADKENHIHETEVCFICDGDGYIEKEDYEPEKYMI